MSEAKILPQIYTPTRAVTVAIVGLVLASALFTGIQFIWWEIDNVDEIPCKPGGEGKEGCKCKKGGTAITRDDAS